VEDGVIVARTDSLGAGLTKQIAFSKEPGDLATSTTASSIARKSIRPTSPMVEVFISRDGKLLRPKRLPSNLYQFRAGTGEDRVRARLHHLAAERRRPAVDRDRKAARRPDRRHGDRIREVVPNAKLVYNNSPSFNWTLNFRQQVFDAWEEGRQGRVGLRPRQADERRLRRHRAGRRSRREDPHLPARCRCARPASSTT
jgi:isocitrate lyase